MHLSGIHFESLVDGDGVRCTIFVSGCKHGCKGCHNLCTHSFTAGAYFDDTLKSRIINYLLETPYISGITFSGGDPMYSAKEVLAFLYELKNTKGLEDKNYWLYTGFLFEELLENREQYELLKELDVIVDGKYVHSLRDTTLRFRGSSNQRIIDVQKSIKSGSVITLYDD